MLREIHERRVPLSLATSKPEKPAKLILDETGLLHYFDVITGASEDEVRSAKKDVVEEALERLDAFGADISRPVMVGDRHHDVVGAAEHDVPTIFVRWGYGSPAEEVGTIGVATTAAELTDAALPRPSGLGGWRSRAVQPGRRVVVGRALDHVAVHRCTAQRTCLRAGRRQRLLVVRTERRRTEIGEQRAVPPVPPVDAVGLALSFVLHIT